MLQKSDFDPFLKEYWTENRMEVLTYKHRPLLAMMPKNTEIGGEYWSVPCDVDDGADGSPEFDDALAVATGSDGEPMLKQFQVQYVEDFQIMRISNKLIRLSRKAPRLALKKAADQSKKKKDILAQRIARSMYRSGYGELGTIDTSISATSTKILGIANKQDCRNFRKGQRLVFASSTTAALRDSGDFLTVVSVDYDAQKVTTDAPTDLATSIASIANGDTIFLKGARGVGSNPTLKTMQGLAAWNPSTTPSGGENFNGVDRSVWPDRLAGMRFNNGTAASGPVQEILIDSLVDAAIREAYCDKSFVDPKIYGDALKALEGTVTRVKDAKGVNTKGKETTIGFNGFEVAIGYGSNGCQVFPDANCPVKRQYHLTMDTWELGSAGELIQNDLQTGEQRDVENASAVEQRYVFTGAMACFAPGKNMVVVYA